MECINVYIYKCIYLRKWVEVGPYGPSTDTLRWSMEGDEASIWQNLLVQLPSRLIMTLKISGSKLLLEFIVKGCHCSLEMLGTLINMMLVGV